MSSTTMPPRTHPVLGVLALIAEGLDALEDANLWALSDPEALGARVELERIASRVAAAKLQATRELEQRGAATAAGATSLVAWLVSVLHEHPGEAAREVTLATALDRDLPATAAALAAGDITPAAALVIADTDKALRTYATGAERREAETLLAEQAGVLDVRGLQAAALHLRHRLDPDQGDRLAAEEQEQVARRQFRLRMNPDGSSRPDGYLDKEATVFLRTALQPLAKPRHTDTGGRDNRDHATRTADALLELVELALRSGELPVQAGQPVQVVVAISLEDLQGRVARTGAGTLDMGMALSVEAVRRLACDAQVIPAALGSQGEPLDVGRAVRTVPPSLRRLLELRDGGCAFPGCDRPSRWCQAHHVWHWEDGGPTSCDNCVLLCSVHHRSVHHHGWEVRIAGDGLPTFYPPPWIDPRRSPRRNHRLRPCRPRSPGDDVIPFVGAPCHPRT
ncbi:MAG: DUF222 domain-containing protein [Actinomycetes bacterium]